MRFGTIAALAVAVALCLGFAFPWLRTPLVMTFAYGLGTLGVVVLMRAGQISFGHAMFACASGYVVAGLARAWPSMDGLLLLIVATLASAVFGAVLGAFLTRYRGIFFGMLNLGLSMVLYAVIGKFYALTGGTDGLRFERPTLAGWTLDRSTFEMVLVILAAAIAWLACMLAHRVFASAAGQVMAAIKTNETRLEYLGLSARRSLWEAYVASAALVGASGALLVLVQGIASPEMGYWIRSGEYVFIAILGGTGHVAGAFLGAVVFEIIKLFASAYLTNAWQSLLGVTLIAVILFAPGGMSGHLARRSSKGAVESTPCKP